MDTRLASQRVHFEAGIIREQIAGGVSTVVGGLGAGVFLEGGSVFFGRGQGRCKRQDFKIRRGQAKFAQLAGIGGGAVDDHAVSKVFWMVISSAIPCRASASKLASCASSKGLVSAVA